MEQNPFDPNPYAAPAEIDRAAKADADLFREGNTLIARKGATLPARCLVCNSTDELVEVHKTFRQANTAMVLSLGPILGSLFARRAPLTFYVCGPHHLREETRASTGCALVLVGLVLAVVGPFLTSLLPGPMRTNELAVLVPLLSGIALVGFGLLRRSDAGRFATVATITPTHVHLKGVHPDFVNQLAE